MSIACGTKIISYINLLNLILSVIFLFLLIIIHTFFLTYFHSILRAYVIHPTDKKFYLQLHQLDYIIPRQWRTRHDGVLRSLEEVYASIDAALIPHFNVGLHLVNTPMDGINVTIEGVTARLVIIDRKRVWWFQRLEDSYPPTPGVYTSINDDVFERKFNEEHQSFEIFKPIVNEYVQDVCSGNHSEQKIIRGFWYMLWQCHRSRHHNAIVQREQLLNQYHQKFQYQAHQYRQQPHNKDDDDDDSMELDEDIDANVLLQNAQHQRKQLKERMPHHINRMVQILRANERLEREEEESYPQPERVEQHQLIKLRREYLWKYYSIIYKLTELINESNSLICEFVHAENRRRQQQQQQRLLNQAQAQLEEGDYVDVDVDDDDDTADDTEEDASEEGDEGYDDEDDDNGDNDDGVECENIERLSEIECLNNDHAAMTERIDQLTFLLTDINIQLCHECQSPTDEQQLGQLSELDCYLRSCCADFLTMYYRNVEIIERHRVVRLQWQLLQAAPAA